MSESRLAELIANPPVAPTDIAVIADVSTSSNHTSDYPPGNAPEPGPVNPKGKPLAENWPETCGLGKGSNWVKFWGKY